MKRFLIFASILFASLLGTAACQPLTSVSAFAVGHEETVNGSGNVVTQTFDLADFDNLHIGYGFRAEVSQGDIFSVAVSIDDNLLQFVNVEKFGNTLSVGFEFSGGGSRTINTTTQKVEITMPHIDLIELGSGGRMTLNPFVEQTGVELNVSAGASLQGDLEAASLRANVNAGSSLRLSGSAKTLDLRGSAGSGAQLMEFAVEEADIWLSAGSHAEIDVSHHLDAAVHVGSHLTYRGNPELGRIVITIASSISRRD
jgi:hypothetical protein